MNITTTYKMRITGTAYNRAFEDTVSIYRNAVAFLISVCLDRWDSISATDEKNDRVNMMEHLVHSTKTNTAAYPDFDRQFYKFPCYLLRAAIADAMGKVSSYKSNLANWQEADPVTRGREPSVPCAGSAFPCMYRNNMYKKSGEYTASIKVWIRNTWDWVDVRLRRSDAVYILRYCRNRKECAPTLTKRGKKWSLDFPFEEKAFLTDTGIYEQTIVAVDLGINNAATVTAMRADGTILGRRFIRFPELQDSLQHALNRIRKAQQHGARRMPRLWARAKGINDRIAVMTAGEIVAFAKWYGADVIVFEHLETRGKKKGSKKQRLHHWRAAYVQKMVALKAHRAGMHCVHVNACGTSRLAYDGSECVERGIGGNYSICQFTTGKIYNCNLNALYNIGARYFIREIIKSLPEKTGLQPGAKVPQVCKRSTCTLSTLISLSAELAAIVQPDSALRAVS